MKFDWAKGILIISKLICYNIPALRMELAMQSKRSDGRRSFIICLNFSLLLGASRLEDVSSTVEDGSIFPRLGSLTVSKITSPTTIPGMPAIMNDQRHP